MKPVATANNNNLFRRQHGGPTPVEDDGHWRAPAPSRSSSAPQIMDEDHTGGGGGFTDNEDTGRWLQRPSLLLPHPPPSQEAVRVIKIGERLANHYDLSCVDDVDKAPVLSAISAICTIEDNMPLLDIRVEKRKGFYVLIIQGCDIPLDIKVLHSCVFENPSPRVNMIGGSINPKTGVMTLRVGMTNADIPVQRSEPTNGVKRMRRLE